MTHTPRGKLDLDPATVKQARALARKAGRPIVTLAKKRPEEMTEKDYLDALKNLGWVPNVIDLVDSKP